MHSSRLHLLAIASIQFRPYSSYTPSPDPPLICESDRLRLVSSIQNIHTSYSHRKMATTANAAATGLPSPPTTEKAASIKSPPRVVLAGKTGRILCVADIRGDCELRTW